MNWLKNLLNPARDPSARWVTDPSVEIAFDLHAAALCGVRVGEPLRSLSFLGPCEPDRLGGRHWGWLWYGQWGFAVFHRRGRVTGFRVNMMHTTQGDPDFRGRLHYGGQDLPWNSATPPEAVRELLGQPFWEYLEDAADGMHHRRLLYDLDGQSWTFAWLVIPDQGRTHFDLFSISAASARSTKADIQRDANGRPPEPS